ncbi:MAG: hypothetical protein J0I06_02020 [Planctomycetes bacterium]|nr:hypothetical protein [Planctomycetota bacterium]
MEGAGADEQLVALYHRHVATAFDRKLRLAELVELKAGGAKWQYTVATATLAFGKLKFEAPLLGTHARGNDSWLWAWSNRNLKLALTNRALGDLVRVTAGRLGVPTLAHAGFSLEPLLGPELTKHAADVLGGVLARELDFDAHFVADEGAHDSAILVRDDRLRAAERHPLFRVLTVFPKAVKTLPVFDHRAALTAYARDYGLTATAEGGILTITDGKGQLTATFDEHDRLKKFEGANVAAPAAKKPAKAAPTKAPPKKADTKSAVPKARPAPKAAAKKPNKSAPKANAKKSTKKR